MANSSKMSRPQRIRDPIHNLIEFDEGGFERVIWRVLQTHPFQRLRRIRQLGFTEFVYPGATHSRFAHSVGVFQTARYLMKIIERHMGKSEFKEWQAEQALAAALVHDLGHGMFSHAFEDIGKELGLPMAKHEIVSDLLIRDSEVSQELKAIGSGFANDVADIVKRKFPENLYAAVVSSQFDADRLDYMQRDRLMTGVQSSRIDFRWLTANLEIGTIAPATDEKKGENIQTFVLGPKAIHAAETYVLALFQLYPTVYLHKTTRAAEKLFSALMLRLVCLIRNGHEDKSGLPNNHPIVKFSKDPDSLSNVLAMDDAVFLGALPMLAEAPDLAIRDCAIRLRDRRLPKCTDIRENLTAKISPERPETPEGRESLKKKLTSLTALADNKLQEWSNVNSLAAPRILTDRETRNPYKLSGEAEGQLNQIYIREKNDKIRDVVEVSPVVAALEPFELFRAYADDKDEEAKKAIKDITENVLKGES